MRVFCCVMCCNRFCLTYMSNVRSAFDDHQTFLFFSLNMQWKTIADDANEEMGTKKETFLLLWYWNDSFVIHLWQKKKKNIRRRYYNLNESATSQIFMETKAMTTTTPLELSHDMWAWDDSPFFSIWKFKIEEIDSSTSSASMAAQINYPTLYTQRCRR